MTLHRLLVVAYLVTFTFRPSDSYAVEQSLSEGLKQLYNQADVQRRHGFLAAGLAAGIATTVIGKSLLTGAVPGNPGAFEFKEISFASIIPLHYACHAQKIYTALRRQIVVHPGYTPQTDPEKLSQIQAEEDTMHFLAGMAVGASSHIPLKVCFDTQRFNLNDMAFPSLLALVALTTAVALSEHVEIIKKSAHHENESE